MFVENTQTFARIINVVADYAKLVGHDFESLAPHVGKAFIAYVQKLSTGERSRMGVDWSDFELGVYDTLESVKFVKQWSGEDIGNANLNRDQLEVLEMCKALVDVPMLRDISENKPPQVIWGGSLIRLLMRSPYYKYNYGEGKVA